MEYSMEDLQNIKNRITIWFSNSTSGNISKGNKNTNLKRYLHPMFIAALFTIAKTWKQPKYSLMDEWIKKLFSHKRQGNPTIYNNVDGPWSHYTKWNKSDRERQILYDLTYMWDLRNKNKKQSKLIEKGIRLVVTSGRGLGEGELQDSGQKIQTASYKVNKY